MIWNKAEFKLCDERDVIDIEQTHNLLSKTYWAKSRSRKKVEAVIANSICFSVFRGDEQVGFVRVVSDYVSMSWVADMVIKDGYQGQGLGLWMMECVMNHPRFENTQFALQTEDAHQFYEKLGFEQRDSLMSTATSYLQRVDEFS